MNYKNILIMCGLVASCTVHPRQEQELFLQAAHDYEAGKISEAYKTYQALPLKSAGTLYNMGNCAYRLHDYGRAVGYWMQALVQAPRFMYPSILSSLEMAQQNLELPIVTKWQKIVLHVQSYIPLVWWQIITLSLMLLGVVLWFCNRLRWWSTCMLILAIVVSGACSYTIYSMWYSPHVVIVAQSTKIHAGPDEQFPVVQEIPVGMRAAVVGNQDSWYKISYLNNRGWVEQSRVMSIL